MVWKGMKPQCSSKHGLVQALKRLYNWYIFKSYTKNDCQGVKEEEEKTIALLYGFESHGCVSK